jgi:hypothetical protein
MRSRLILGALLLSGVAPVQAQSMRDYSVTRQRHGEGRLDARLEFASGTIHVTAGSADQLYHMLLRYDPDRFLPVSEFDAGQGSVSLGLTTSGRSGLRVSSRSQLTQLATVELSPAVALALDVQLGAADAELELGGLQLTDLALVTGASQTSISFSRPNRIRCSTLRVESGATQLDLVQLGNSRCQQIVVSGGVGRTTLDLRGAWGAGSAITVKMTMGGLTLRIPRGLGVKVRSEQFLSRFPSAGWTRTGGAFLSPGYARASSHVDLDLETALGSVSVEWM